MIFLVIGCGQTENHEASFTKMVSGYLPRFQTAAVYEDMMFFRTKDDELYIWKKDQVTLLKENFYGYNLKADKDKLYYVETVLAEPDAPQCGLFRYSTKQGTVEQVIDYTAFPELDICSGLNWWSDGKKYYLCAEKENGSQYALWVSEENGNIVSIIDLPCDVFSLLYAYGERILYNAVQNGQNIIKCFNWQTEETSILQENSSLPIGYKNNQLLFQLNQKEGNVFCYEFVNLDTGERTQFTEENVILAVNDTVTVLCSNDESKYYYTFRKNEPHALWICSNGQKNYAGEYYNSIHDICLVDGYFCFFESVPNSNINPPFAAEKEVVDFSVSKSKYQAAYFYAIKADGTVYLLNCSS